jgi:uncharacterized protein
MRWLGDRESDNVEDRRNEGGGGGGGMMVGGSIGTLLIALVVYLLGGDPSAILNGSNSGGSGVATAPVNKQADDQAAKFTRVVLADTEDVWTKLFAQNNDRYRAPVLVMFRQRTRSGCGMAAAESGPFYCPADKKIYIDLSFYDELRQRFRAPGEFAMAYVIAHEVGHCIQDQWGILDKVHQAQERMGEVQANRLSVRLELQADFLAGVWARYYQETENRLEQGDIEAALRAAQSIGDDRIQQQTQGYVQPEAFTHGTAAQRAYWFMKGYKTGDLSQGDTFNSNEDARLQ